MNFTNLEGTTFSGIKYYKYTNSYGDTIRFLSYYWDDMSYWDDKYEDEDWYTSTNQTIAISSKLSEVENGEELLTWLKANAVKQSGSTDPT